MARLSRAILARLDERGISARAAALGADLPIRAVQGVIEGHVPSIDRADEICRALDIELYLGPPRGPRKFGYSTPKTQIREAPPAPPRALEQGLSRIDDPALRDLLAAVAAHWGALDDYGRGHFLADLWAAGGSGLRAQASSTSSRGSDGK